MELILSRAIITLLLSCSVTRSHSNAIQQLNLCAKWQFKLLRVVTRPVSTQVWARPDRSLFPPPPPPVLRALGPAQRASRTLLMLAKRGAVVLSYPSVPGPPFGISTQGLTQGLFLCTQLSTVDRLWMSVYEVTRKLFEEKKRPCKCDINLQRVTMVQPKLPSYYIPLQSTQRKCVCECGWISALDGHHVWM